MVRDRFWMLRGLVFALICVLAATGCGRKKYENPITKDTQQPDKVLFDKAIKDLEKGRYEVARLTLQTLMNTYDTSEYLAKAKLAYADSWFREGGMNGLAQAEAEYKDFILFYPTLEEAAEAQEKVCMIHYRQMEKADRDMLHAVRAEDECRNLLNQFPNSKFAPRAQQLLRNVQEVIAEGEMRRGSFYHNKGSYPAAANRLTGLANQYPLYSQADRANFLLGDAYERMGARFRGRAGEAYSRILREYPLSDYADDAKKRLQALEMPVPEADPVAYARHKYELENRTDRSLMGKSLGFMRRSPDVSRAAKSGTPAMTSLRPGVPASVPPATPGAGAGTGTGAGFSGDVTVAPVTDPTVLDSNPDARIGAQGGNAASQSGSANGTGSAEGTTAAGSSTTTGGNNVSATPATNEPLPSNRQPVKQQKKKKDKNGAK
ncbi:MAG TPA: outer membrane protein assembly factor BamD [Bryobacteraceae bacterium]|jgi:outer membrane protein assembly factor BamD|nr:outer membrane protein assembly factor BamD [Bryobacteraceae bacterium]